MRIEKNYGNCRLTKNKLKDLKNILDDNDEINKLIVDITIVTKTEGIKINLNKSFSSIGELIDYIEKNNIDKINILSIELWYKETKKAFLEYDRCECCWILKYDEKNNYTDSIVYNLNTFFKNRVLYLFKSHVEDLFYFTSVMYIIIKFNFDTINDIFLLSFFVIWAILFFNTIFKNRCAYWENQFFERNRDSIILSIIFYALGVITPYILQSIFK